MMRRVLGASTTHLGVTNCLLVTHTTYAVSARATATTSVHAFISISRRGISPATSNGWSIGIAEVKTKKQTFKMQGAMSHGASGEGHCASEFLLMAGGAGTFWFLGCRQLCLPKPNCSRLRAPL
jgi:hypothetical protein